MADLEPWSRLVRVVWWLCFLAPPVTLVGALDSSFHDRSADEALGLLFILFDLLLVSLALCAVLLVRTYRSRVLSPPQKSTLFALGLSAIPLYVVTSVIAGYAGYDNRHSRRTGIPVAVGVTAVWMWTTWRTRGVLTRGEP